MFEPNSNLLEAIIIVISWCECVRVIVYNLDIDGDGLLDPSEVEALFEREVGMHCVCYVIEAYNIVALYLV